RLYDTAGLRDTDDIVEQEGIRRTRLSMAQAHLVLLLSDAAAPDWPGLNGSYGGPVIRGRTDADVAEPHGTRSAEEATIAGASGLGMAGLLEVSGRHLPELEGGGALAPRTRQRQIQDLADARTHSQAAIQADGHGLDIRAEHLRLAGKSLG